MIDVTGGFDPRNLLKKPPGIGMETGGPQDPIDMYRSDMPPGVMGGASPPQTPVSMERSAPQTPISSSFSPNQIPNVPPHQPIGGGGVVPGVTGNTTSLPSSNDRSGWIQPGQSGYSNVQWSGQGTMPTDMGGIIQRFNDYHNSKGASDTSSGTPYTPRGDASPYQAYESVSPPNSITPNYTGPSTPPGGDSSGDIRLGYGFNDNQWALNRAAEAAADKSGIDFTNPGSASNPYNMSREQWLKGNPSLGWYGGTDSRNPAGFVPGLPDETAWRARRAQDLQPYNQSVTSERAAGRMPGSSQQIPNYTAPVAPPIAPQPNYSSINQSLRPLPPEVRPQDRYLGTQRRTPSYF